MGLDIANRKRVEDALRKTEERYRSTLDTILEGCQLLGFDWRYLYLNPAAAIQNRRANSELLGRTMPEAWPGIEGSNVFAMLRRCMDERIGVRSETEFEFADGHKAGSTSGRSPSPKGSSCFRSTSASAGRRNRRSVS
ncbi:MAG: PAS domain-containing protein [Pseudomonadota bacterium]